LVASQRMRCKRQYFLRPPDLVFGSSEVATIFDINADRSHLRSKSYCDRYMRRSMGNAAAEPSRPQRRAARMLANLELGASYFNHRKTG
jgi:hypothetical protein